MRQEKNDPAPRGQGNGVSDAHNQQSGDQPHPEFRLNGSDGATKKSVSSPLASLREVDAARAYLNRIGAQERSLRRWVIREYDGAYWIDKVTVTFAKDGTVATHPEGHEPTESEAEAIKAALAGVRWPTILPLNELTNLPAALKHEHPDNLFLFRQPVNDGRRWSDQIVMVQQRVEREGKKNYLPWTYWDEGATKRWRQCEPDFDDHPQIALDGLPLYNAHRLGREGAETVYLHEGAKGARYCQWLADAECLEAKGELAKHPWGQHLRHGVHVGWIGGAKAPHRTDWSQLKNRGVTRVVIVSDNDEDGEEAAPAISRRLDMTVHNLRFDDKFPKHFDLGDPFPDNLFKEHRGQRVYVGPSMAACMRPATWATYLVPNPRGKPTPKLRDLFAREWFQVTKPAVFVHKDHPQKFYSKEEMSDWVRPFSDAANTAGLLANFNSAKVARVDYAPDQDAVFFNSDEGRTLNTYRGPRIKPLQKSLKKLNDEGALDLWYQYLDNVFPMATDRRELKRWVATLVACPDVHMEYGLLMVSERQGTGKSTLLEKILAPLVGWHNVSVPDADDTIKGSFNTWKAHRRLVLVHEIYAGNDSRAYNALKSVITEETCTIKEKYLRDYEVSNWCHVAASSNSRRCLKLAHNDRRWLVVEVTEELMPTAFWREFNEWIAGGGLEAIAAWARDFEHHDADGADGAAGYVKKGQHAPDTHLKRFMVRENMTPGEEMAHNLAEAMAACEEPVVLTELEVEAWVHDQRTKAGDNKQREGRDTLRSAMAKVEGVWVAHHSQRVKADGYVQHVIANFDLRSRGKLSWKDLRSHRRQPCDVLPETM